MSDLGFLRSAGLAALLASAAGLVVVVWAETMASAQSWVGGGPIGSRVPSSARHCPKILMFDGLDIHREVTEEKARYWGKTVGVDGFFLNNVMVDWQVPSAARSWAGVKPGLYKGISIGSGPQESGIYEYLKEFQKLYSRHGVSYNFIKARSYQQFNWLDPKAEAAVVQNFRDAAHLAQYAGLRGIALDVEPTHDLWKKDARIPEKGRRAYRLGDEIGRAIRSECPECDVIVLPELIWLARRYNDPQYTYAPDFWHGLVKAHPHRLYVATEFTYGNWRPDRVIEEIRPRYVQDFQSIGVDERDLHFAPGLWPLGNTYTDKSARPRWTPEHLYEGLRAAMIPDRDYVWIYGHGSAWETDGAYGKGKVDPRFSEFTKVIHEAKRACGR